MVGWATRLNKGESVKLVRVLKCIVFFFLILMECKAKRSGVKGVKIDRGGKETETESGQGDPYLDSLTSGAPDLEGKNRKKGKNKEKRGS